MVRVDITKPNSKSEFIKLFEGDFESDPERFVNFLSESLNSLLATDLNKANRFLLRIGKVFKYLPEGYSPRYLSMQARVAHWSGKPHEAMEKYQKAVREFEKFGNLEAAKRTGIGLMDVYMYLGNHKKALSIGQSSLDYFQKHKMKIFAANAMINIGNIHHRLDKNHLALKYYNRAREIYVGKDKTRLAMAEYNRANVFSNMYELGKAAILYQHAADIYRDLGQKINQYKAEYSLAYLDFLGDNYVSALQSFERLYDEFLRLGETKAAAVTRLDLVEIHLHLNQYGAATLLAQDLIKDFENLGMQYEKGKAQYFAALATLKFEDFDKAWQLLSEAHKTFTKEKNLLWLGMVQNARAKIYLARRRLGRAAEVARAALELFNKSGEERRKVDAQLTLIEIDLFGKNKRRGLRSAKSLASMQLVNYQRFDLDYLLGRYYKFIGRRSEAIRFYNSASKSLDKMLTGLYPDEIRHFFLHDKATVYSSKINCLLEMGQIQNGFISNLKLLSLLNPRRRISYSSTRKLSQKLQMKIENLRGKLKVLNSNSQLGQRQTTNLGVYKRTEQELWLGSQKVRLMNRPRHSSLSVQYGQLENLTDNLDDHESIVNYINTKVGIAAFCASKQGVKIISLQMSSVELAGTINELNFLMENELFNSKESNGTGTTDYYLNKLYTKLLLPLENLVIGRKVFLTVDGLFAQIPWPGLFRKAEESSKEITEFAITPNPADIIHISRGKWNFSESQNATFAVSTEFLPSVETEAENIKRIFPNMSLYRGTKANLGELKNELQTADGFVHIAAHASRSSENPLFSKILMDDGPFFPFDLFDSGLKSQLVTLSGCQTAAPGLYYGNSFTLAKSFLQAGSRFVLASLWPVSDSVTADFMSLFYSELKIKNNPAEAYTVAVNAIRDKYHSPAHWSAFVLMGI